MEGTYVDFISVLNCLGDVEDVLLSSQDDSTKICLH